jgi:hypothetical protein
MATGVGKDGERKPLCKESDTESDGDSGSISAIASLSGDSDSPHQGMTHALGLCVLFSFGVQSVTNTQLLASSQIGYVSDGPWFFMLVQSLPILAGVVLCVLANLYDESFDRGFGIIRTMHFRIVIVGSLTSILAIGIAILESGHAQVLLGFLCAFCASGTQMATFQLVAVLNPKWQAVATTGLVLASIVPIQTLEAVGVDIRSQWTMRQRILVFAPSLAITLVSITLFAAFWPRDWPENLREERPQKPSPKQRRMGDDPAILGSPRSSTVRSRSSIDTGLTAGLRRLVDKEAPRDDSESSETADRKSMLKWPPFPFWLVSLSEFVNGTMYCVQPLVALTPTSGDQANLIIARFWGEILGQLIGAAMVLFGLASANFPSVGMFLVMTLVRVAALFWIVPSLLEGGLLPSHMFYFLITANVLYCIGTAVVVMAARPDDRRKVSQTDMGMHFVGALTGVAAAAVIIAVHPDHRDMHFL